MSYPHTRSKIMLRDSTLRGFVRKYSSSRYSVRVRSSLRSPRNAMQAAVSIRRSRERELLVLVGTVLRPRLCAAHAGADPRKQLFQCERLDEVVVGAGVESGDAVAERVLRGQHQHRRARAARAHPPAHLEAVHRRHRHVQDHDVGRARAASSSASGPSVASVTSKPSSRSARPTASRSARSSSTNKTCPAATCREHREVG